MELIDWRELYESNRAVIEGREPMRARGGFTAPSGGRAARRPRAVPALRSRHGRRAS